MAGRNRFRTGGGGGCLLVRCLLWLVQRNSAALTLPVSMPWHRGCSALMNTNTGQCGSSANRPPRPHPGVAKQASFSGIQRRPHYPEHRVNRISGYLFNASGGKGRFLLPREVRPGQFHYVLVVNATPRVGYPNGYTKIYRNGVLANQNELNYRGTSIVAERGSAPFRVGTRDFKSFSKVS